MANIAENRCRSFNAGGCSQGTKNRICPRNPRLVHYCTHCGGKHPVTECTQAKKRDNKAAGAWGDGWIKNKKGKWVQK